MKKNNNIHIKISTEQKEKLKTKAQECGLSLSQYCLFILLNTRVKSLEMDLE